MEKTAFRQQLERDLTEVFLDLETFGESVTVRLEGEVFRDIPGVRDTDGGLGHNNTKRMRTDKSQGLSRWDETLYCAKAALGGRRPEPGQRVEIESRVRPGFFVRYTVEDSREDEGMLSIGLKRVDD